jgi:uncharacterized membrane protein
MRADSETGNPDISDKGDPMPSLGAFIHVNTSAETAYDLWKQFETLPQFLEVTEQVSQRDNNPRQWTAEILGEDREWDPEITCQTPHHHTVWPAQSGITMEGVVSFHAISDVMSTVLVQITDTSEAVAVRSRVQQDLERFEAFVETHLQETRTAIDSWVYQAFP